MGTTCTALVLSPEGALAGHVGDSRRTHPRCAIDQLTFDHSLQWELIREGKKERRHPAQRAAECWITRCLGPEAEVNIDIEGPHPVLPGDVYLLCSDGLTGFIQRSEIGVVASELPRLTPAGSLINMANLRGGQIISPSSSPASAIFPRE